MRARIVYFLYGAVCLLAQVILLRRLLSVFYGNELTIGALFAGWMFWTGVGGFLFSKLSDQSQKPEAVLSILLFGCALIFLLSASSSWLLRYLFRWNPAVMPGLGMILSAGFLISAPSCILLGASFNYLARMFEAGEKNLVRLYLWEALGSAGSGIVFSFVLAGRISPLAQIVICSFLIALPALLVLKPKKIFGTALALSIVICAGLLIFSNRIEKRLVEARWKDQEVLLEKETKYASITISRSEAQTNFWLDGLPAFSYPNPQIFEQVIHLPLAMCPKPEKVLLIGGGLLGAVQELFQHPVQKLVYLQIDPALTALELKYLPGSQALAKDPRLKIVHQDARIFLSETKEKFDVIILNLPDPETASLNRYYTQEFFERVKNKLKPAGVFSFGIGVSGNYLSDAEGSLLANALLSLKPVFPKTALLPLGRNYLVASEKNDWLTESPELIVARLQERGVKARFVREYYLNANLSPERVEFVKNSVQRFFNQPANTDLRPRGYYLSALLWLEQASPGWRGYIKPLLELGRLPLILALLGYLVLGLRLVLWKGKRAFAGISIFSIGFAGISAELGLILGFQVAYGYIYHWMGILISGFMVGLSLGAYFYQKIRGWFTEKPVLSLLLVVLGEALAIILSILGLRILVHYPLGGFLTLMTLLILLLLVAIFSGICFPLCAYVFLSHSPRGIGYTAGWLNAWDHFGSALGALVTGLILIPLFGLTFSLWFFVLLILASLIPILLFRRKDS